MSKKIKSLIFAFCSLIAMPLFFACGEKTKLSTPTNIKIDGDTYNIVWNEVKNADYYKIEINGKEYEITSPNFTASDIISKSGKYDVRVCAYTFSGKYLASKYSNFVTFENKQKLTAPILEFENYILSWQPIKDANFYTIVVNGSNFLTTKNQFDLLEKTDFDNYIIKGQENTFQVFCSATSNYKNSEKSNSVSVFMAELQNAPLNLEVKKENENIMLSFDKVETAKSGYTYFIDENPYKVNFTTEAKMKIDITDKLAFGKHTIKVKCNEVKEGDTIKFLSSSFVEITYENIPSFVNDSVKNLQIDSNLNLTFDAVKDANAYEIIIKNETSAEVNVYISDTNNFNLALYCSDIAHYSIKVRAKNGNYISLFSETKNYANQKNLDKPELQIYEENDNVYVNILAVENALGYNLSLNGKVWNLDTNCQTLVTSYLNAGDNTISCFAIGDYDLYLDSSVSTINYNYVVVGVPTNLKVENKVLTFDKVIAETETEIQYKIYLNDSLIETISQTTFDFTTYCNLPDVYKIGVSAVIDSKEGKIANQNLYVKFEAPKNLMVEKFNDVICLSFDKVDGASSYSILLEGTAVLTNLSDNIKIDITQKLKAGNNNISVVANGKVKEIDSDQSGTITYNYILYMPEVKNIQVVANKGKYYLQFDEITTASAYSVKITDSKSQIIYNNTVSQFNNIDIDSILTNSGDYSITVTTQNTINYVDKSANTTQFVNLYNKTDYQQNKFFYDGKDYTYCIKSAYDLEDFVFYAVLYRLSDAEIYIDFDYDNIASAFDSDVSLLEKYIPSVEKFGVDLNSQSGVIEQLFNINNLQKIEDIVTFIERCHDQIYLYYTVDSKLTSQKSNRVYNLNFAYKGSDEATSSNELPNRKQADLPVNYQINETARTFAIDSYESYEVETVAQLLMIVQNKRKPLFVKTNTIAEQTYNAAKNILKKICNDQMTDYQKVAAIHDYIVTNNHYDNTTYESASGAPFDEKNLNDMAFYASGMLLKNLSVCKGITQAFALMCNIEGIETIECFGLVSNKIDWSVVDWNNVYSLYQLAMNSASIGAHSWNRVKLDAGTGKKWYIVDCTWDDLVYGETEVMSHEYFLVSDNKIAKNRKEMFCKGTYYKKTDTLGNIIDFSANENFDYYSNMNSYISSQTDLDAVVLKMKTNNQNGFEIKFNSSISSDNYNSMITLSFTNNSLSVSAFTICKNSDIIYVFKN